MALAHAVGDKVEAAYRAWRSVREAAKVDGRLGEVRHHEARGSRRGCIYAGAGMKKYNSANDDEFRKLSERSNALLDKHRSEQPGFDPNDETTAAEIALIGGQLSPQGFAEVGDVEKAEHLRAEGIARDEYLEDPEQFTKCRKREQIIAAKDDYDLARLFSLVGYDPELRLFAVSYKRRPGTKSSGRAIILT